MDLKVPFCESKLTYTYFFMRDTGENKKMLSIYDF
jgi:hypothetical protein